MLSVAFFIVMLSANMLGVVILNVNMLKVVVPFQTCVSSDLKSAFKEPSSIQIKNSNR
jgi:hypothetical protein